MSQAVETPDITELQSYLPALRQARKALRAQEKGHVQRFEPRGLEVVRRARSELEELVEILQVRGE